MWYKKLNDKNIPFQYILYCAGGLSPDGVPLNHYQFTFLGIS